MAAAVATTIVMPSAGVGAAGDGQAVAAAAAASATVARRKRKRWGAETEAGLRVLQEAGGSAAAAPTAAPSCPGDSIGEAGRAPATHTAADDGDAAMAQDAPEATLEPPPCPTGPAGSAGAAQQDGVEQQQQQLRRRRRGSRWEPEPEQPPPQQQQQQGGSSSGAAASAAVLQQAAGVCLPGGLQVMLPASLAALVGDVEQETKVAQLTMQLSQVNQRLQMMAAGKWVDDAPAGGRSPSPEPVYNAAGTRTNMREARARAQLTRRRNELIGELVRADPQNFRPPPDWRPQRKSRKLRVPVEDYPGYNFIGLIIGPRGNTQKRMERETGCRIAIRGRGSAKEGRPARAPPGGGGGAAAAAAGGGASLDEHEDLHVLITGEDDEALDRAAAMVERLLRPVDDEHNEHKQQQMRELATINGTLREPPAARDDEGQAGAVYRLPRAMRAAADEQYRRDVAAVHGPEAVQLEDEYKTFLQELGGAPPPEPPAPGSSSGGHSARPGVGAGTNHHHQQQQQQKQQQPPGSDPCHLYVANLPHDVTDASLEGLFTGCGLVRQAMIVRDRGTGQPRGIGFVRMADECGAAAALQSLHGYLVGGKRLTVRIKGRQGPAAYQVYAPVGDAAAAADGAAAAAAGSSYYAYDYGCYPYSSCYGYGWPAHGHAAPATAAAAAAACEQDGSGGTAAAQPDASGQQHQQHAGDGHEAAAGCWTADGSQAAYYYAAGAAAWHHYYQHPDSAAAAYHHQQQHPAYDDPASAGYHAAAAGGEASYGGGGGGADQAGGSSGAAADVAAAGEQPLAAVKPGEQPQQQAEG